MRGHIGRRALVGAALAVLLALGCVGVAQADSTPPPTTTPAPDPAPPLPKPKPAPRPAPKPAPRPAHVYHAPIHQSTPAQQPTYTPPPVSHHVVKKAVHHARKRARPHRRVKHVAAKPKVHAQVKHASVVHVAEVPAAAAATVNGSDAARSSLVITGFALAALLFLLVVTLPSSGMRFSPPGRVLMDHQTHLVLAGLAVLLLAALLFALTGNG